MRIYYRAGPVLVTESLFHVTGRPPLRIDEFDDMYIVNVRESESSRGFVRRMWPALVAVAACVAVSVHDTVAGGGLLLVPATVLMVSTAMLLAGRHAPAWSRELWAVTGTGHVCLFRSGDRRTFDQVRRAVIRAREAART